MAARARRRGVESARSGRQPGEAPSLQEQLLVTLQQRAGNRAVSGLVHRLRDGPRDARSDVVQLVPMVEGEFTDPTPQDGTVLAATGDPLRSPPFQPTARFNLVAGNPDSAFRYGGYRQLIRGAFRRDGVAQKHLLDAGPMSEDTWQEDAQGMQRYGYRSRSQGVWTNDRGEPDRANGCRYQSSDQPSAAKGDHEIDLHFNGRLVDTGDAGRVIAERTWRVYGRRDEQ
jgi:hypothetical protein